ncbi:PREDICTED: methylthioribulose-1-phosphate dehydratase-like [Priapulus caudatus]|uniref:Methylthioribulose-1-phosphate dehydratase-like n=1 Tax=Priapulus caudatus TaxID=37621 RepID=A0ABM1ERY9_PRICU|nr:PREDICTED: methylthioribulose-1-phosphate dehydratase-like [Priapulus caudatus]
MDPALPEEHPRNLIPELCRLFYDIGWVTGTGGGVSIRYEDLIYIAPSGVQKERIKPEDMFVQTIEGEDITVPPPEKKLKKSQCTPLFMNAFTMRAATAVIHTQLSQHAGEWRRISNEEPRLRVTHL